MPPWRFVQALHKPRPDGGVERVFPLLRFLQQRMSNQPVELSLTSSFESAASSSRIFSFPSPVKMETSRSTPTPRRKGNALQAPARIVLCKPSRPFGDAGELIILFLDVSKPGIADCLISFQFFRRRKIKGVLGSPFPNTTIAARQIDGQRVASIMAIRQVGVAPVTPRHVGATQALEISSIKIHRLWRSFKSDRRA